MSLFYPTILRKRVTSITAEDLRALGVRGLLLDVDNTLTTHGSQALDPAVLAWLPGHGGGGLYAHGGFQRPAQAGGAFRRQAGAAIYRLCLQAAAHRVPAGGQAAGAAPRAVRGYRRSDLHRRSGRAAGRGIPCIQVLPIQLEEHKPLMQLKRRLEKGILARYTRKTNTTE